MKYKRPPEACEPALILSPSQLWSTSRADNPTIIDAATPSRGMKLQPAHLRRRVCLAASQPVNAAHPVCRETHSVFKAVGIFMIQVTNRFRGIDPFQLRSQDLSFLMMHELRISAGHLQDNIRQLLDRVQIVPADVIRLACAEVVGNVRHCPHCVGKISGGSRVSAKDGPRQTMQCAIKKPAIHRTIRTVVLTWTIGVE